MSDGCQWIEQVGKGRQEAEFCGADTLAGSSYCEEHHVRIWKKPARFYGGGPLDEVDTDSDDTEEDFDE